MSGESQDKRWFRGRFLPVFQRYRNRISIGAGVVLGLIFLTSGVGKLLEPTDFLNALTRTSLLSSDLSAILARVLPWTELVLGVFLILGISIRFMSGVSYLLIMGFIAQNILVIRRQLPSDDCGCFGGLSDLLQLEKEITLSAQHALYMDIGMLVLSLIILFCYPRKLFAFKPWFWRGGKSQAVEVASGEDKETSQ